MIDSHREVARINQRDHFRILIRDLVHDVAPVAPDRAEIEQHEAMLFLRLFENGFGPRLPFDFHPLRALRVYAEEENLNEERREKGERAQRKSFPAFLLS